MNEFKKWLEVLGPAPSADEMLVYFSNIEKVNPWDEEADTALISLMHAFAIVQSPLIEKMA